MRSVIPQLISYGRILRPIIGIELASDRWIKRYRIKGLPVVRVDPGLPADQAGISGARRNSRGDVLLGDVITHLNGIAVRTNDDYLSAMEDLQPGDTVILKTRHDDEEKQYKVRLTESQ